MGIRSRFRRLLLALDCDESNIDAGRRRCDGGFELLRVLKQVLECYSPSLPDTFRDSFV